MWRPSRTNVLDYDDLLLYWAQMIVEGAIAQEISARFDHVLVDEYQDTNRLQASILLALKPNGRGLTVVGDDAQSIYSFRAATVRNILDFPGHFSPKAEIITLECNTVRPSPFLRRLMPSSILRPRGLRKFCGLTAPRRSGLTSSMWLMMLRKLVTSSSAFWRIAKLALR